MNLFEYVGMGVCAVGGTLLILMLVVQVLQGLIDVLDKTYVLFLSRRRRGYVKYVFRGWRGRLIYIKYGVDPGLSKAGRPTDVKDQVEENEIN
jgi:cbb3-type cytochrome oxidase cytochrome c subunit